MSIKNYFRWSLALPIVLPLLVWAASAITARGGANIFEPLSAIIIWSLFIGGVPYSITAIGALWWMRNKPAERVQKISWFAPLLMLPALLICTLVLSVVNQWENFGRTTMDVVGTVLWDSISGTLFLGVFTLIIGYGYVVIVNMALAFLITLRKVYEDDPPTR